MIRGHATTAFLALVGLYLVGVTALFVFQRRLIHDPARNAPSPTGAGSDGATEHALAAADGTRILLWHAPAEGEAATVLYFQGKGGEIADRPDRWADCRASGLGVAFLSYRGHGGSAGSPTEAGLHQDADAAYDRLLSQGISAGQIVVVGESLGTGVATRLAADRKAGALITARPAH